jgi:CO/xanthine dehydrogenase FAD-binding subunit
VLPEVSQLQPFDYVKPKDHAEASALLASGDGAVRALLGGTDLIVRVRSGYVKPQRVVDLKGLPGMREISPQSDGSLRIGAGCTMNKVAGHPDVQARFGLLAQACNSVASYQLRNRATIGGNCCNASPAADTAPALYCLDALAEIYGPAGRRCLPIPEFFVAPGRTPLRPGEFLISLFLPPPPPDAAGAFHKLGRTRVGDIAMVSVAVYGWAGGRQWQIALGAVGPTPLYAPQAATALSQDTTPTGVAAAAALASATAQPIDDIRASAGYRTAMVRVLTRRGIELVLARLAQTCPGLAPDHQAQAEGDSR